MRIVVLVVALVALATGAVRALASTQTATHTCPRTYVHAIYNGKHKCLSVGQRKQIYWELTHWQDTHPGQDVRAYYVIAKRWQVPVRNVRLIAVEGARKN